MMTDRFPVLLNTAASGKFIHTRIRPGLRPATVTTNRPWPLSTGNLLFTRVQCTLAVSQACSLSAISHWGTPWDSSESIAGVSNLVCQNSCFQDPFL